MSKEKYNPYENCSSEPSPIEVTFAKELESRGWVRCQSNDILLDRIWEHRRLVDSYGRPRLRFCWASPCKSSLCIYQFPIKPKSSIYFVDFAFLSFEDDRPICVELDGHEFHEKNKTQVSNDKKREREIALSGWTVLRFSGSEIQKSAKNCIDEFISPPRSAADPEPARGFGVQLEHDGKEHLQGNPGKCKCQACRDLIVKGLEDLLASLG